MGPSMCFYTHEFPVPGSWTKQFCRHRSAPEDARIGGAAGMRTGSCGFDLVKLHDAAGELVRGERRFNDVDAGVVRCNFREFACGTGPRAIARRLNEDGVSAPSVGKLWTELVTTRHGQRQRDSVNQPAGAEPPALHEEPRDRQAEGTCCLQTGILRPHSPSIRRAGPGARESGCNSLLNFRSRRLNCTCRCGGSASKPEPP